jgi:hypothetical protein
MLALDSNSVILCHQDINLAVFEGDVEGMANHALVEEAGVR